MPEASPAIVGPRSRSAQSPAAFGQRPGRRAAGQAAADDQRLAVRDVPVAPADRAGGSARGEAGELRRRSGQMRRLTGAVFGQDPPGGPRPDSSTRCPPGPRRRCSEDRHARSHAGAARRRGPGLHGDQRSAGLGQPRRAPWRAAVRRRARHRRDATRRARKTSTRATSSRSQRGRVAEGQQQLHLSVFEREAMQIAGRRRPGRGERVRQRIRRHRRSGPASSGDASAIAAQRAGVAFPEPSRRRESARRRTPGLSPSTTKRSPRPPAPRQGAFSARHGRSPASRCPRAASHCSRRSRTAVEPPVGQHRGTSCSPARRAAGAASAGRCAASRSGCDLDMDREHRLARRRQRDEGLALGAQIGRRRQRDPASRLRVPAGRGGPARMARRGARRAVRVQTKRSQRSLAGDQPRQMRSRGEQRRVVGHRRVDLGERPADLVLGRPVRRQADGQPRDASPMRRRGWRSLRRRPGSAGRRGASAGQAVEAGADLGRAGRRRPGRRAIDQPSARAP